MKRRVLALASLVLLCGCGDPKGGFGAVDKTADRRLELSPKERAAKLPNELFHAVWSQSLTQVERVLSADSGLIESLNGDGDSALGFALRTGAKGISLHLLAQTSVESLHHVNKAEEGYVFLSARAGFHDFITAMADRYFGSRGTLQGFDFSDLDQANAVGERALFVAANRTVAEALEVQYYRGFASYPFWQFTLHNDLRSRTFIHTAALEGRDDVILWAAEKTCAPGRWETSESAWQSWPATALTTLLRGAQIHVTGDLGLPVDLIFNQADDEGQTPLMKALTQRRWSTVRALASCRWLDYDRTDQSGNTALHVFLKALNPFRRVEDVEAHRAFQFLMAQNTRLRFKTSADRVNRTNNEGETALHLAARLADPFFYSAMVQVGDVFARNRAGQTAESLFKNRQSRDHAHSR